MAYVDGMVAAVPTANKDAYVSFSTLCAAIFKEHGCTSYVENWGDDVQAGKVTDFIRSVQATAEETVVFSWVGWPDKAARDAGWAKIMEDARMNGMDMPFDGKRMIYGGFETVVDL